MYCWLLTGAEEQTRVRLYVKYDCTVLMAFISIYHHYYTILNGILVHQSSTEAFARLFEMCQELDTALQSISNFCSKLHHLDHCRILPVFLLHWKQKLFGVLHMTDIARFCIINVCLYRFLGACYIYLLRVARAAALKAKHLFVVIVLRWRHFEFSCN